jgi:hypothetical protein
MTPATDNQKLFIFRLGKLANDENRAIIEGVTKAYGTINGIDTTLTESEISKYDAINYLEAQRGDQDPMAFLESVSSTVLAQTQPADFGQVRKALNEYRNFLTK